MTDILAEIPILDTFYPRKGEAAADATEKADAAYAAAVQRANHTGTQDWNTLTGTPTTLAGYGIADGATTAAMTAANIAQTAALIEAQGLAFDGTGNATIPPPALGTSDFLFSVEVGPTFVGDTFTGIVSDVPIVRVNPDRTVSFIRGGVGVLLTSTSPLSAVSTIVSVVRSSSVVTIYFGATAVGSVSDSSNYVGVVSRLGGNTPIGVISRANIWNYAPSLSVISEYAARGLVTLPEQRGGSMTNLITNISRNSDFSAGATDWVVNGGGTVTVVSNQLSMAGGLFWAGLPSAYLSSLANGNLPAGTRWRIEFDYISGASTQFTLTNGGTDLTTKSAATGTHVVLDGVIPFSDSYLRIRGNGNWVIDNVVILKLGTLYELGDCSRGHGPVIPSPSGEPTILPADGVTGGVARINPNISAPLTFRADIAGASGNSFVLGSDVQRLPVGYAITRASVYTPTGQGAANVTLGTSSGGTQIATSTAVTAAANVPLTLASAQPVFALGTRLYLNRSATLNAGSYLTITAEKVL